MLVTSEYSGNNDVVSRFSVIINVKDVFDFGEQISREVVKQLSDIIADDLVSRKAEELLGLIDMDVVARGIEHRIIAAASDKIIKYLSEKNVEEPRKLPGIDRTLYGIEQW